eukprot:Gb_23184 [translate_table: standard]
MAVIKKSLTTALSDIEAMSPIVACKYPRLSSGDEMKILNRIERKLREKEFKVFKFSVETSKV